MRTINVSKQIEQFLNFIRDCESAYTYAYDVVNTEDKRAQDLLHAIEFETDLSNLEDYAAIIQASRIKRRVNKDLVETLDPVISFLSDKSTRKTMNMMTQVLGRVRKIEEKHENRRYHPRVKDYTEGKNINDGADRFQAEEESD